MKLVSLILGGALIGCAHSPVAYQGYPLSFDAAPFYATANEGSVLFYAGYGYDLATFDLFAFDLDKSAFVAEERVEVSGVSAICEGPNALLFARSEDPLSIRYRDGTLALESAAVACPAPFSAPACGSGRTLFHERLQGRDESVAICLAPRDRQPTFHLRSPDGSVRDLGPAGTAPAGSGRFVATRGAEDGTFLVHHTRSGIAESAVTLDLETGTLAPFDMPALTEARPSRGFGAGRFGVTLHPARHALVAEGEGGDVFLLRDGTTERIAEGAAAQSVRVVDDGCGVTLIARTEAGTELRVYDICYDD